MGAPARSWLRRLRRLLLVLLVLGVCLAAAGKVWIGPYLIRRELRRGLQDVWDGRVEVSRVEVRFFGPPRVARVALRDARGRTWLEATDLELRLRGWPGTQPCLTDVDVGRAAIRGWIDDGRIRPPLKRPSPRTLQHLHRYVDLEAVRLADADLTLVDAGRREATFTGLGAVALRDGRRYRIRLERRLRGRFRLLRNGEPVWIDVRPAAEPGAFKLACTVDPNTLHARIEVRWAQDVPGEQGAAILSALKVGDLARTGGRLVVDVTAEGLLKQPASLKPQGSVRLIGWEVGTGEGPIARKGSLTLEVGGPGPQPTGQPAGGGPWTGRIVQGAVTTDIGTARARQTAFRYDPSTGRLDADLTLELKIHQDGAEDSFWSRLLWFRVPQGRAALAGPITYEPGAKQPLRADLRGWLDLRTVRLPTKPVLTVSNVRSPDVRITHDRVRISSLTADVYGGTLRADLRADRQAGGPRLWNGLADARDISTARLSRALSAKRPMSAGKASARVGFTVRAGALRSLQATGVAFVDNADLWKVPVLSALFEQLGRLLRPPGAEETLTDAEVAFTMDGPVATITAGRLANPVSAVLIEPGGKIDLRKRQVDVFVVVAPLKHVRSLLSHLPLIKLLVMAQEKLARVHLQGPWDRPPAQLVTEAPLKGLTDATLGLLQKIAEGGGQLGQGLLKPLDDLLKGAGDRR